MDSNCGVSMIPVGYVFRPTADELLWTLADNILNKERSVRPPEIRSLDLYGNDSNPWTLLEGVSEQPCYVLTKLRKAGPGQSRIKRTAGVGTWKEQKSCSVTVTFEGLAMKGLRRYFAFQPKKGSIYSRAHHGQWIMNEYSLEIDQHCALCEIHNKDGSRSSSKRKNDDPRQGVAEKRIRSDDCNPRVPAQQCDNLGGMRLNAIEDNVGDDAQPLGFPDGLLDFSAGFSDEFWDIGMETNPEEQCSKLGGLKLISEIEDHVGSSNSLQPRVFTSDHDHQIPSVDLADRDRESDVATNPMVPVEQYETEDTFDASDLLSFEFGD